MYAHPPPAQPSKPTSPPPDERQEHIIYLNASKISKELLHSPMIDGGTGGECRFVGLVWIDRIHIQVYVSFL